MMKRLTSGIAAAIACLILGAAAHGETASEIRDRVNKNVVYVVGGSLTGTNSALVWDMAKLMDDGYDMRVLPIAGRGSMKTTEDILYLQGVDIGTVQADVLDFFTTFKVYPTDPKNALRYISALHAEEVHAVVRRDSEFNSLSDLEGKTVNFGPPTSGTFLTSTVVFDKAGVTVNALDEAFDFGLEKLRKGEIDAIMRIAGAPTGFLEQISIDEGLKLIPVEGIGGLYKPAKLTSDQYPGLIPLGESVDTISVSSVLVAYNHPEGPRRDRVERFSKEFRKRLPEFKSGGSFHEKWQDVDIEATLSGWTRWGSNTPDP